MRTWVLPGPAWPRCRDKHNITSLYSWPNNCNQSLSGNQEKKENYSRPYDGLCNVSKSFLSRRNRGGFNVYILSLVLVITAAPGSCDSWPHSSTGSQLGDSLNSRHRLKILWICIFWGKVCGNMVVTEISAKYLPFYILLLVVISAANRLID